MQEKLVNQQRQNGVGRAQRDDVLLLGSNQATAHGLPWQRPCKHWWYRHQGEGSTALTKSTPVYTSRQKCHVLEEGERSQTERYSYTSAEP